MLKVSKLSVVECYWGKKCYDPVTVKWHPSKIPDSFLWVCEEHFKMLRMVYEIEEVKESVHYTTVRAIPEKW